MVSPKESEEWHHRIWSQKTFVQEQMDFFFFMIVMGKTEAQREVTSSSS